LALSGNFGDIVVCKKSVANYVIEPPGLLSVLQQQYQLVDLMIITVLNLVGVDSMSLDLRYSNSARCAVETWLSTNRQPQIIDEARLVQ
jgi:hypothetical protein